jgi:hypothetical protein
LEAFNLGVRGFELNNVPQFISTATIAITWAGVSISTSNEGAGFAIGRNLASVTISGTSGNNAFGAHAFALPTEIILAPGESFGAVCGVYNIVVIPENG